MTFASLANGAKLGNGNEAVTVNASDNRGVTSLSVAVDGSVVSTTTASTLSYKWTYSLPAKGILTLSASARDAAGNV